MKQPSRFEVSNAPHHIWKLDKPLYGLKQAARTQFSRISSKLHEIGFTPSMSDTLLSFTTMDQVTALSRVERQLCHQDRKSVV